MTWELREVGDIDCTLDDSGVYVVINRVVTQATHKEYSGEIVQVRADLMAKVHNGINELKRDEPIMSWIGTANNVRKHLIQWLMAKPGYAGMAVSLEHASYIGYELHRAEVTPNYVQD